MESDGTGAHRAWKTRQDAGGISIIYLGVGFAFWVQAKAADWK